MTAAAAKADLYHRTGTTWSLGANDPAFTTMLLMPMGELRPAAVYWMRWERGRK